jgi:hypothetical protein
MPKMYQKESSEDLAIATISHWSKQFAGIKCLDYFTPDGDKICFDYSGRYIFTFPFETCKQLGLKP